MSILVLKDVSENSFSSDANIYTSPSTGLLKLYDNLFLIGMYPCLIKNRTISLTAVTGNITTTDTRIGNPSSIIPANSIINYSKIRVTLVGTCTTTVANAVNIRLHWGTNGSISDPTIFIATFTASASGTDVLFRMVADVAVRTIGASGTIEGNVSLINNGTTGISTTAMKVVQATYPSVFDTTVYKRLCVSANTGAATTSVKFQQCIAEIIDSSVNT
jgi:hypothetical protein